MRQRGLDPKEYTVELQVAALEDVAVEFSQGPKIFPSIFFIYHYIQNRNKDINNSIKVKKNF